MMRQGTLCGQRAVGIVLGFRQDAERRGNAMLLRWVINTGAVIAPVDYCRVQCKP